MYMNIYVYSRMEAASSCVLLVWSEVHLLEGRGVSNESQAKAQSHFYPLPLPLPPSPFPLPLQNKGEG